MKYSLPMWHFQVPNEWIFCRLREAGKQGRDPSVFKTRANLSKVANPLFTRSLTPCDIETSANGFRARSSPDKFGSRHESFSIAKRLSQHLPGFLPRRFASRRSDRRLTLSHPGDLARAGCHATPGLFRVPSDGAAAIRIASWKGQPTGDGTRREPGRAMSLEGSTPSPSVCSND